MKVWNRQNGFYKHKKSNTGYLFCKSIGELDYHPTFNMFYLSES